MNGSAAPSGRVRWGVIGAGGIAAQFVADAALASNATVSAVASRSAASAARLLAGDAHIARFGDAASLLAARACDAIYIATPNDSHATLAIAALEAGYPVLVEKPIAITAADARRIADASRAAGRPAMEAMWTAFLPAVLAAETAVARGAIGRLVAIDAELAYLKPYDPASRFFVPAAGGGALLDLGVYPLAIASLFAGPLALAEARWQSAPGGVDMAADLALDAANGVAVRIRAGFDRDGANVFVLRGERASLILEAPFLKAQGFFVARGAAAGRLARGGLAIRIARRLPLMPGARFHDHRFPGGGLQFQIEAFGRAVASGDHAALWPLARSAATLALIEATLARSPGPQRPMGARSAA